MNAIDIIVSGDLATDFRQIVASACVLRIHIAIGIYLADEPRKPVAKRLAPQPIPFAHRYRHHPGMALHPSLMTLINGKLQGIVARAFARKARQTTIPRLIGRGVNHRATHPRLNEHRIDMRSLKTVKDVRQLSLLLLCRMSRLRIGVRPVDATDGRQPHRTHLILGSHLVAQQTLRLHGPSHRKRQQYHI